MEKKINKFSNYKTKVRDINIHFKRIFKIIHWADMESGGHFVALEKQDLFVKYLRALRFNPYYDQGRTDGYKKNLALKKY